MSSKNAFDVDLAALLRVFGGHLYSTPAVFARELVQNALDAIAMVPREGETFEPRIVVEVDPDDGVVRFVDEGVGLDAQGLREHLGSVGASSKRRSDRREVVGQFGIGLLSGFLVADHLVVETRCEGGTPLRWTASADGTYQIGEGARIARGTEVLVRLREDARSFADPRRMRELLDTYVPHVNVPVHLRAKGSEEVVITRPGLWSLDESELEKVVAERTGEAPLAVLSIATPTASGVLWLRSQPTALGQPTVELYHHGILVDAAASGLLPRWAGFVSGVLNADGLSPTASREGFVHDAAWDALSVRLSRELIGYLANLPERDPARMDALMSAHRSHVVAACVDDAALLAACGGQIPLVTSRGVTSLDALLDAPEVMYTTSLEDFGVAAPLSLARDVPLINASHVHEEAFLDAWRKLGGRPALRALDLGDMATWFGEASEHTARFAALIAAARRVLSPLGVEPSLRRFSPSEVPVLLLADGSQLRERAQAVARSSDPLQRSLVSGLKAARAAPLVPLVLNVDNPLVSSLPELVPPETGARVVRMLYVQAAQRLRRVPSLVDNRSFADDMLHILRSTARKTDHDNPTHH